jgi:hypothetical protein
LFYICTIKLKTTMPTQDEIWNSEIGKAAQADFASQTKYDNAYDRKKGFIAGAKKQTNRN